MPETTERHEITKKTLVHSIPGVEAVTIRRDVPYRAADNGPLGADIYYPPGKRDEAQFPAVVFVFGFSDVGGRKLLGCTLKEMESYIGWAKLTAASGMIAVTYTNREPSADVHELLDWIRTDGASLGIDQSRVALFAFSGNVPLALSVLMEKRDTWLRCAVLCYGYTLDLDGSTAVAEAATTFGFVNAPAGKAVQNLPPGLPLLITRSGQDQMPRLNEALDGFLAHTVACNLPITFVNHRDAPHAFDLFHDSSRSREIIEMILTFLRSHLETASTT